MVLGDDLCLMRDVIQGWDEIYGQTVAKPVLLTSQGIGYI